VSEIRWEEPPTRGPGERGHHIGWAELGPVLVARTGEWALVVTYDKPEPARSMAYLIRKGRVAKLAALGRFEATSRKVDGEYRIYVRFMGGGPDA
jgi:hypothetical protein